MNAASSPRQPRKGPAPFASFDHEVSDEVRPDTSPETKLNIELPEIREDAPTPRDINSLASMETENRIGLRAPGTPRIDISRASSSSQHDSRDSSPEAAFREEGALDLRSSTEELTFFEGTGEAPRLLTGSSTAPTSRRHSRKDSQCSEAALLGVYGRTSRVSSVGSQCSAMSRLSGTSRSPSPHKMLLETSFCGPKPIDNEPDMCEQRLLEVARLSSERRESAPAPLCSIMATQEKEVSKTVRQEKNETEQIINTIRLPDADKKRKESQNSAERRRKQSNTSSRTGDIIRIRLKPDSEYDDNDINEDIAPAPPIVKFKPDTLELTNNRISQTSTLSPARIARTPQRKSSFCSLFRSSPESPATTAATMLGGMRCRKSFGDPRPRSTSRDRLSATSLRGSVLSLFRGSRKQNSSSPPPQQTTPMSSITPTVSIPSASPERAKLKYYEDTKDGIIHIPLHTPPDGDVIDAPQIHKSNSNTTTLSNPIIRQRTVLADGSIIIPLHSPTETESPQDLRQINESPPTSKQNDTCLPPLSSNETRVEVIIENHHTKPTREHVVFQTNIGSDQNVFTTQLSVTKTPSIGSQLSNEIASLTTNDIVTVENVTGTTPEHRADSSGSEASSEARAQKEIVIEDAERRGLVNTTQESFDEELPYVPTTLPLERSLALPMIPVKERGDVKVAPVSRPRPPAQIGAFTKIPSPMNPAGCVTRQPTPSEKIHINLPLQRTSRSNLKSTPSSVSQATSSHPDWIDFEEVPEKRKQPKRIQQVPVSSETGCDDAILYADPEHCRCECHRSSPSHSPSSSPSAERMVTDGVRVHQHIRGCPEETAVLPKTLQR